MFAHILKPTNIFSMKQLAFLIIFIFSLQYSFAQKKESVAESISSVHAQYGLHFPAADMEKRYGVSQFAGIALSHKTKTNWMFDLDFTYFFGGDVKIHDSLFKNIVNSSGTITDGNGEAAEVFTYERGYFLIANIYKILPVFAANKNSGLTIGLGSGFMQHKIRVYNPDNTAPQVCGDYKKGYDYLSNGIAFRQYIGYTFFAPRRIYSFRVGFEVIEGLTEGRRSYLFPIGGPDTQKRLDILYGLKLNWTIPLKKTKQTYFYN